MTSYELQIEPQGQEDSGRRILRLSGKLSMETVFGFNQNLRAETAPLIILDLSPLSYMDSAGVGALVQFQVRCARAGQQLILAGLTPKVHAVLQVANVLSLFRLAPSAADVAGPTR